MKILIASDSYKGSLSSKEVADNIIKGFKEEFDDLETKTIIMADGGEGTVEASMENLNCQLIEVEAGNPLGNNIKSYYAISDNQEAIIEMASVNGITLVDNQDIRLYNTYGTGQLIKDALDHGCKSIYIGIGGSATNDGGIGMANALGVKFYDESNKELAPIPNNLSLVKSVDTSSLDPRIKDTKIIVMCDVTNPLCGSNGASHIYGPQKGASKEDIEFLDAGLKHLASIINDNKENVPGSGAAGGLGYGLMTFLNATLKSGVETILTLTNIKDSISDYDLIITGEGRIDNQSINGKVPVGVAKLAKEYNKPCVAIVGSIGKDIEAVYEYVDTIESSVDSIQSLDEAITNASLNVYNAARRLAKAIKVGYKIKK